jgi:diguanylate cyclase (GGDEF)-like protein
VAKTEQIQAQIRGILKSGQQTFETRHRHRNGDWVDLEITATGVDGRYVVALLRNVSDRRLADRKIHHLAFFDELTGLPNRRLLQDRIEQALVSSSRGGCGGAIVFVDLDNFKLVNDSCGHAAGDALLVKVSECLRGCVRLGDTVARQGGDEFVLVLEGLSADPAQAALQAESIAEKCRRGLEQSFSVGASEFFVSASFGVALFFGSDSNFGVLLQRADTAMYQAKFGGRNRVVFFEPEMQRNLAARTQLESDLRHALSDKQLVLYLQPMVNSPGQLLGAEMLLRWQHPQRGLLTPGDFILAAEETGLILPIGAWVLESACRQLASWKDQASTRHLRLAVNVSALQFMQPDFVDRLRDLLILGAFDPSNLTLELSERLVNKEPELVIAKVHQAQALGVSIAMDNFGAGLSSLTNLRRLPLRQLKIDQSFVHNLADDPNNMIVVQTIIAMAKALGLEVVAEGVESEANRAILEHNGCAAYQGYLFSRPLPLAEFEAKIRGGW